MTKTRVEEVKAGLLKLFPSAIIEVLQIKDIPAYKFACEKIGGANA